MFEKNREFLTEEETDLIREKKVVITGLGALGQMAAHTLVRGGFERLVLVDGDVVSESDFNRQLYADILTVGVRKTELVCEKLSDICPRLKAEKKDCYMDWENSEAILSGADMVLDCVDNIPARICLEKAAEKAGIPLIHGAVDGWFGQVCTVFPGEKVLSLLYENRKEQIRTALMPAVNVTASFQAAEAVKIASGKGSGLRGKILCIDMLNSRIETISVNVENRQD